jgi:DNA-binding beta-propeller fold protein YncE
MTTRAQPRVPRARRAPAHLPQLPRTIAGIALAALGACGGHRGFPSGPTAPTGSARAYSCGRFTTAPSWTIRPGFRAVVVADEHSGLSQPVALTVAGGAFGGKLYVVNAGTGSLVAIDPDSGAVSTVVAAAAWPSAPTLLTAVVHDDGGALDGNLYVADEGSNGDGDSRIFRVTPAGAATQVATGPGPGLDDIFALAFAPGGAYPTGLLATGDTDGDGIDWGIVDRAGTVQPFSDVAGAESAVVDRAGTYGGGVLAARPGGGGYSGDDTISRIDPTGHEGPPLAKDLPGVHGLAIAPPGPFGGLLHGASWEAQNLFSVSPAGAVTELASGLALTNYDANILAFSPDGRVLYVADRDANRVVCIEPTAR